MATYDAKRVKPGVKEMNVGDLVAAMQSIAPLEGSCDWDNTGLLVGQGDWSADRLLLTIDLTPAVLEEAIAKKCDAVVSYHPPIFAPMSRLSGDGTAGLVLSAATAGLAIYAPHTALDAAANGITDWFAASVGEGQITPLVSTSFDTSSDMCKLVTFVPEGHTDQIRAALYKVGCGAIGDYESCSFKISGTGTFLPGQSTNPVVGEVGNLEMVDEHRLEMVCQKNNLSAAVDALRANHPYEEVPVDIYPLLALPKATTGPGRMIDLAHAQKLEQLIDPIKAHLGVDSLRVAAADNKDIKRVGVCCGAGGSLMKDAMTAGCQLFVTGEARHHDVLAATQHGMSVVLAGHTNTERGYLPILDQRLSAMGSWTVDIANADQIPWQTR